jgi:hypothetical protein
LDEPGWRTDAQFEQVLNLGFPVGERASRERVDKVVEGEQVMWWKDEDGVRSCHIWRFEELSGDRTLITNVEVFHGASIGMIKILVGKKWLRLFDLAVDGLVRRAGQSIQGPVRP